MENIFKQRLYDLRIEKGLNQQGLAAATNLSQAAISRWEKGERIPDINVIITLCNYFNVSTDYILGRISYEEEFGNIK